MRKLKTIEIERLSVEEFRQAEKFPLVVVLDDVRSLHNVGSVFRTADAFAVEAVYLCGITAQPPMPEIHKTALGAEDSVEWRYFPTTEEAVEALHAEGRTVYAVEQCEGSIKIPSPFLSQSYISSALSSEASPFGMPSAPEGENEYQRNAQNNTLQDYSLSPSGEMPKGQRGAFAVILGNEVKGVKQSVIDMCDGCLEIPQFGTKHSLNVSVAAGIIMYELVNNLLLE